MRRNASPEPSSSLPSRKLPVHPLNPQSSAGAQDISRMLYEALCGKPRNRAIGICFAVVQKLWRTEIVCGKKRKNGAKSHFAELFLSAFKRGTNRIPLAYSIPINECALVSFFRAG
jgi:hypothetical protein